VLTHRLGTFGIYPFIGPWRGRLENNPLAAEIDTTASDMRRCNVQWVIYGGNCGVGFSGNVWVEAPRDALPTEIIANHRVRMLERDDCFTTRAEAEAEALAQLRRRADLH